MTLWPVLNGLLVYIDGCGLQSQVAVVTRQCHLLMQQSPQWFDIRVPAYQDRRANCVIV